MRRGQRGTLPPACLPSPIPFLASRLFDGLAVLAVRANRRLLPDPALSRPPFFLPSRTRSAETDACRPDAIRAIIRFVEIPAFTLRNGWAENLIPPKPRTRGASAFSSRYSRTRQGILDELVTTSCFSVWRLYSASISLSFFLRLLMFRVLPR